MDKFLISRSGLKNEAATSDRTEENSQGFSFSVLALEEWAELPNVIRPEFPAPVYDALEKIGDQVKEVHPLRRNEGFLGIHPRAEKLAPGLTYVCYRGIDPEGKEYPIRFFLGQGSFVLIGWNGLTLEQLEEWAKRGLLTCSDHLAQFIGSQVLEEHQGLLEQFEDQMDFIEEGILKAPRQWQQSRIMALHQRVIGLKKSLNAHLSVYIRLANLGETEGSPDWEELVQDTQRELDNVRQTHELVENLREAYQTALDNRANDIMKLLTLLATVLLPINLLTSFFGMNFENMPLIHQRYGMGVFYSLCLAIMAASLWFFHKKNWQK